MVRGGDPTPPGNPKFYGNDPFGCRGEHCSPAAFTRYIALVGAIATGGIYAAPTNDP